MSRPFAIRDDLTDRLVHLVRGAKKPERPFDEQFDALFNFSRILYTGTLKAGTYLRVKERPSTCFTEMPLDQIARLCRETDFRYFPAGIMVAKSWLYDRGGRPVIYQPLEDVDCLSPEKQFLHVTYDPKGTDFAWEREWRAPGDIHFTPNDVTVIFPIRMWADYFIKSHFKTVQRNIEQTIRVAPDRALDKVVPFPWYYIVLDDLGVPLDHVRELMQIAVEA